VSVAAVLGIVLLIALLQRPGGTGVNDLIPPPANVAASTLADGEALGRPDAPVQLEIWADFQCPVCGTLVRDYLPRLASEFVVSGQVRIVPHDIAIVGTGSENESLAAAIGARCAGAQGKYWAYHDWLYANQRGENRGAFSADRLAAIANEVGLDRAGWDACIADPAQAAAIRKQTSDALSSGVNSTPTFRFGGQVQVGLPRTYAELAAVIRAAVERASPPAPGPSPASSGSSASPSAASTP
jgi:protein-disulfide isomerase